jgi:hypothetical protein
MTDLILTRTDHEQINVSLDASPDRGARQRSPTFNRALAASPPMRQLARKTLRLPDTSSPAALAFKDALLHFERSSKTYLFGDALESSTKTSEASGVLTPPTTSASCFLPILDTNHGAAPYQWPAITGDLNGLGNHDKQSEPSSDHVPASPSIYQSTFGMAYLAPDAQARSLSVNATHGMSTDAANAPSCDPDPTPTAGALLPNTASFINAVSARAALSLWAAEAADKLAHAAAARISAPSTTQIDRKNRLQNEATVDEHVANQIALRPPSSSTPPNLKATTQANLLKENPDMNLNNAIPSQRHSSFTATTTAAADGAKSPKPSGKPTHTQAEQQNRLYPDPLNEGPSNTPLDDQPDSFGQIRPISTPPQSSQHDDIMAPTHGHFASQPNALAPAFPPQTRRPTYAPSFWPDDNSSDASPEPIGPTRTSQQTLDRLPLPINKHNPDDDGANPIEIDVRKPIGPRPILTLSKKSAPQPRTLPLLLGRSRIERATIIPSAQYPAIAGRSLTWIVRPRTLDFGLERVISDRREREIEMDISPLYSHIEEDSGSALRQPQQQKRKPRGARLYGIGRSGQKPKATQIIRKTQLRTERELMCA